MLTSTIFVQEPDYSGFRKMGLPVQAMGVVYDGRDPYATPLGVVLMVLESNRAREVYIQRGVRMENGKTAYTHDLGVARYVINRNGFEKAQLQLGEEAVSDETKGLIREFLLAQNTKQMNGLYVIQVGG